MIFLILLSFCNLFLIFHSIESTFTESEIFSSLISKLHAKHPGTDINQIKNRLENIKKNNPEKYSMLIDNFKKEQKYQDIVIDMSIENLIQVPTTFEKIEKSIDNTLGEDATKGILNIAGSAIVYYTIFKIIQKINTKSYIGFNNNHKTIISFEDIAGYKKIKEALEDIIEFEVNNEKNKKMTGILFYGPTGTGKTLFAQAFATEAKLPLIIIDKADLESKWVGQTEKNIKQLFINAKKRRPCVIFIDEIDAFLGTRKENDPEYVISAKNTFSSFMDSSQDMSGIVFIGATNRLESIDPIFKRPGRLGHHILIDTPNAQDRKEIIMYLLKKNKLTFDTDITIDVAVEKTNGLSPAELTSLITYCEQIIMKAYKENKKKNGDIKSSIKIKREDTPQINAIVTLSIFKKALALVMKSHNSSNLEFEIRPDDDNDGKRVVSFEDIAGYKKVKEELEDIIEFEINNEKNKKMTGILFYGPTGTGKTLFAQSFATEAKLPLIITDSTILQSKWIGETEKNIKQLFINAKKKRPCVIFIDEIDAFLGTRKENDPEYVISAKNTFSSVMDSSQDMSGIVVIGATNRLESIDPIFKRPGRLGHHILIDIPNAQDRKEIIIYLLTKNKLTLDNQINIDFAVEKTDNLSPAELTSLITYCEQIIMKAHKKKIKGIKKIIDNTQIKEKGTLSHNQVITLSIFEQALAWIMKSHNNNKKTDFTSNIYTTFKNIANQVFSKI